MRLSCNGCRVLRKGCSENCTIKPCLQWIDSPESQAHATLFLAKFYGRAGLINLINAGPEHLRPAIFRSLLYEASGRIVNPVYGSVGLLGTGSRQRCEEAVEAVLRGEPIKEVSSSALQAADIRHVSKDGNSYDSRRLSKVKSKIQFKRLATKPKYSTTAGFTADELGVAGSVILDQSVSWLPTSGSDSGLEGECISIETVTTSQAKLDEPSDLSELSEVELELTLGSK